MRGLLDSLLDALRDRREVIHCQVVETRGSTPQKAGARMLVLPEGGQIGTLGGGCVEAEVKQKAIRLLGQEGEDAREIHSFVLDHDYAWADGLICGGKMVILAEVLDRNSCLPYFEKLHELTDRGGFTEMIVIDAERAGSSLGTRKLVTANGGEFGWPESSSLGSPEPLASRPRPSVRDGVAHLPTLPRITLIVVGAGHVGQAVADLASRADFDVWVVDDRRQYANAERFPLAQRFVVGPIEETLPELKIDPNTYALIVTRGHGHDQEALFHLAQTSAAYVGLIGSRRKIRMIFEALREQGVSAECLARVAAPVGVDIGSESVTEIAISIVAELVGYRNLHKSPESIAAGTSWR